MTSLFAEVLGIDYLGAANGLGYLFLRALDRALGGVHAIRALKLGHAVDDPHRLVSLLRLREVLVIEDLDEVQDETALRPVDRGEGVVERGIADLGADGFAGHDVIMS